MRKVAVVGAGETKFSGSQTRTCTELFSQAAMDAIAEANIKPKDIQALFVGNSMGGFEEGQQIVHSFIAENIGAFNVPATQYDGACASSSVAIREAFIWVASGFYDIVLVGGTERAAAMGTMLATRCYAMYDDARYEYPCGLSFPGVFAMLTHMYAKKYNLPLAKLKEQMALVSVKAHEYAFTNPKAHYHKKLTVEKVLKSFMVCDPLQLYDCCPFSDGASVVVLASEEAAKKLTAKPVFITGIGQASAGSLISQQDYLPKLISREISAKQAYTMAGVTPSDIDVCEVHDSFSIAEIMATESLGFFDYGTGGAAAARGETRLGGKIPVNPSGGLKGKGHPVAATGAAQVYELVRQLRGECGEMQVQGAKTALADAMGASGSVHCTLILEKGW